MHDESSYVNFARNMYQPNAGDDRLWIEFKTHPMHNEQKSVDAGRPIYDDVEFVKIIVPGDKDIYFQPASPEDKRRFRRQYEDFKAGRDQSESGSPLALLPGISEALVQEFLHFKVRTIEQLAHLNDSVATQFVGFHEWKRKANEFLQAAQSAAPLAKAQAELEKRDAKVAELEAQLKELAAAVAKQSKSK